MVDISGNSIFYGLDNCEEKIENIINILNLDELCFEIKLIIFEALTNAFIHGNKEDKSKPIFLEWYLNDKAMRIYVTDCGYGFNELSILKKIDKNNILEEGGRGLYIIKNYTDEMHFCGNTIIMTKYV